MLHLFPTKNKVKNEVFRLIYSKDVFVEFSWPIRIEIAYFSCTLVHKKFKKSLIRKIKPNFGVVDRIVPRCALKSFSTRKLGT